MSACAHCGAQLPPPSRYAAQPRVYCSRGCKDKAWRRRWVEEHGISYDTLVGRDRRAQEGEA